MVTKVAPPLEVITDAKERNATSIAESDAADLTDEVEISHTPVVPKDAVAVSGLLSSIPSSNPKKEDFRPAVLVAQGEHLLAYSTR
jgi:uncharacterized protein YlxP (DUF503 family)